MSADGAREAVEYHVERPVQIESLPATVLNAIEEAGGARSEPVHSHRSDGLEHPAADALDGRLPRALMLAVVAASTLARGGSTTCAAWCSPGSRPRRRSPSFGKVLSPQFMLWLVPLAAVAWAWRMYALALVTAAAIAATLVWFPDRYFDLVAREEVPLAAVGLPQPASCSLMLALVARELCAARQGVTSSCSIDAASPSGAPRSAPR